MSADDRRGEEEQPCTRDWSISVTTTRSYQAAYQNIVKAGLLGDIYYARLGPGIESKLGDDRKRKRHQQTLIRVAGVIPTGTLAQLAHVQEVPEGLLCELGSHQDHGHELVLRFASNRGVYERWHLRIQGWTRGLRSRLCDLQLSGGRTATFTSIQSNAFDDYYEMYMGTNGTLDHDARVGCASLPGK